MLESLNNKETQINEKDLDWKFTRGSGPGGQHKNKTDSCVHLTHIPSGLKVKVDGRSQASNKETALFVLRVRLKEQVKGKFFEQRSKIRKEQVGAGMRGDKIRTIRVRDDIVIDHRLNKKVSYKKYSRGDLSKLR